MPLNHSANMCVRVHVCSGVLARSSHVRACAAAQSGLGYLNAHRCSSPVSNTWKSNCRFVCRCVRLPPHQLAAASMPTHTPQRYLCKSKAEICPMPRIPQSSTHTDILLPPLPIIHIWPPLEAFCTDASKRAISRFLHTRTSLQPPSIQNATFTRAVNSGIFFSPLPFHSSDAKEKSGSSQPSSN